MKVIVSGKGGSGKSTLAAMLATALQNIGYRVLLVDADESNFGLHRLMGVSYPVSLLDSLGGKKGFRGKMVSPFFQGSEAGFFRDGMSIDEIPESCIAQTDGIRLLVIGKIHHFGEGCACPMGALSKLILSKLDIKDNEIVIIDTAAGVEHFGRGVDAAGDLILGIVDPTYESFLLAKNMQQMAARAEIEIFFILNKIDEQNKTFMIQNIGDQKVVAVIPKNDMIYMDNLAGKKLQTHLKEIDTVCRLIEDFKNNRKGYIHERTHCNRSIFSE